MMPTNVRFSIGAYNATLAVRVYDTDEAIPGGDDRTMALTDTTPAGRVRVHVKRYTPLSTIAHEAVHAALWILWDRGIAVSPDSEEALAYLVGHVTGLIQQAQRAARRA